MLIAQSWSKDQEKISIKILQKNGSGYKQQGIHKPEANQASRSGCLDSLERACRAKGKGQPVVVLAQRGTSSRP